MKRSLSALLLAGLLVDGCGGPSPRVPPDERSRWTGSRSRFDSDRYPASEDTCAPTCKFRTTPTACEPTSSSHDYHHLLSLSVAAAEARVGRIPVSECVCARAHLSDDGVLSDIVVESSTDPQYEDAVVRILRSVELAPVPRAARCALDEIGRVLRFSFGGTRRYPPRDSQDDGVGIPESWVPPRQGTSPSP